ncbi:MAG: c-type cytochrome [Gammaproteobacteria bacterium]|nr:c-type cytochrome [Gammaproteobacteria bacterium]
MKNWPLILLSLLAYSYVPSLYAWPWSTDMGNQISIKPQEPAIVGAGGELQMRSFPKRSIAVTGKATTVANREESDALLNPVAVDALSLRKGRQLYDIYCSACHGYDGKANTPVSRKIFSVPLINERVQQEISEGWLWGTITFGSAIMPAYGVPGAGGGSNDLTVEERWHVVNYIRNGLLDVVSR